MNAAEIIEALGDTAIVAADLATTLPAVSNWKRRGLPAARLLDIVELARRRERSEITVDLVRAAAAPSEAA